MESKTQRHRQGNEEDLYWDADTGCRISAAEGRRREQIRREALVISVLQECGSFTKYFMHYYGLDGYDDVVYTLKKKGYVQEQNDTYRLAEGFVRGIE